MKLWENKKSWMPIFLCWVAYTAAYLGRYSYTANVTAIMGAFGVSHGAVGLPTTLFFFAYGMGQIVNGVLCKYYNKRLVISGALLLSAVLNLALFVGVPFWAWKYIWLLNGAAQSVLWSSLVLALSENLKTEELSKAIVIMSTTVAGGTFIAYGFSAVVATFDGYLYAFLLGAVSMIVAAVAWFCLYPTAFRGKETIHQIPQTQKAQKGKLDGALLGMVIILGVFAVANNLVKDGLTTWVPSILKESFGLPESLSILLTLALPVLGLLGATLVAILKEKIRSFITLCGILFIATVICIVTVLGFMKTSAWLGVLVAFGVISLTMHGVNNVITGMAPLYMRDKINSGLLAGLLNGCCYVGSTISSYGLGSVADVFGWLGVFWLLLAVCCLVAVIAVVVSLREKQKNT